MTKADGKRTIRAAFSLALVLVVASVYALGSFAAAVPEPTARLPNIVSDSPPVLAGKLTGTGHLMIDGEVAQTGATVPSGSRVSTGADGVAVIDLGEMGWISLRPNTSVIVTFTGVAVGVMLDGTGSFDGSLEAGVTGRVKSTGARLQLRGGTANVRSSNGLRYLRSGEDVYMGPEAEAVIAGSAMFRAESGPPGRFADAPSGSATSTSSPTPGRSNAGLVGLIAMAGVAGAIAVGVTTGGNGADSVVVRPSTITP